MYIKNEIKRHIGTINKDKEGFNLEFNVISINDGDDLLSFSYWSETRDQVKTAMNITIEEMEQIIYLYENYKKALTIEGDKRKIKEGWNRREL